MAIQARVPAAPLDPAGLAAVLRPFGRSTMLPVAAYFDPEVYRWEQRYFFGAGWTCVGFSSELARPGDQRAEPTGAGSALLTRDEDGVLHAFANSCRHRGHELLPCDNSAVQRNSVVCPYHSWTYSLAGGLRFASGFSGTDGFDGANWGLVELPAAEWHGLIFVDASGSAPPLADLLATLEQVVAPYEPERLVIGGRISYDVAANWKGICENYSECYHCPVIHPELCQVSPPKSGQSFFQEGPWTGGWMDLRDGMDTMSLDGRSLGVPLRGLDAAARRIISYATLFPNVLLSMHPDYVMTHRLTPRAADRTTVECTWAFAPEALERPGFDPGYAVEFWDITNQQDFLASESVQRGLASEHARPGPLAPNEDTVYQLETMLARGYLGQPVWNTGLVGEWSPGGSAGPPEADAVSSAGPAGSGWR